MPRRARLFVSGAIYHVYCRVARGEFVFDDEVEARQFGYGAWPNEIVNVESRAGRSVVGSGSAGSAPLLRGLRRIGDRCRVYPTPLHR